MNTSQISRGWQKENGVIRFSVTSDGTSCVDWLKRFNHPSYTDEAPLLLDFIPTSGVTTEVVIMPGALFSRWNRCSRDIRMEAFRRNYGVLAPEAACLVYTKFMGKDMMEMGVWRGIVTMCDSVKERTSGVPVRLTANRRGDDRYLGFSTYYPEEGWFPEYGFAFAVAV